MILNKHVERSGTTSSDALMSGDFGHHPPNPNRSPRTQHPTEEAAMPIYQTAHYQVRPDAVERVKAAIAEFVAYVTDNEPGSTLYAAWQEVDDPTKFVHLFIFR